MVAGAFPRAGGDPTRSRMERRSSIANSKQARITMMSSVGTGHPCRSIVRYTTPTTQEGVEETASVRVRSVNAAASLSDTDHIAHCERRPAIMQAMRDDKAWRHHSGGCPITAYRECLRCDVSAAQETHLRAPALPATVLYCCQVVVCFTDRHLAGNAARAIVAKREAEVWMQRAISDRIGFGCPHAMPIKLRAFTARPSPDHSF